MKKNLLNPIRYYGIVSENVGSSCVKEMKKSKEIQKEAFDELMGKVEELEKGFVKSPENEKERLNLAHRFLSNSENVWNEEELKVLQPVLGMLKLKLGIETGGNEFTFFISKKMASKLKKERD